MSYNNKTKPPYLTTAGKITIFTALFGVVAFLFIFLLDVGQSQFSTAEAATTTAATTSVNVLNTPPDWTIDAEETVESSATTPTNSGIAVSWDATGTDTNGAPYFLLICSSSASATANPNSGTPGTAPPTCAGGITNQWAVSTGTVSGTEASAATTTTEAFAESNTWYAWICDDDAVYPRCNDAFRQGSGSTASPFVVNHRPTFTLYADSSPADPGVVVSFYATSSDSDTAGVADTVKLTICFENDYNTSTDTCGPGGVMASSSFSASDPVALYTLPPVIQDQNYTAYGFIADNHGHESAGVAQGTNSVLTVSNVAPTVDGSQIALNNGDNMILVNEAGQTTGFRLTFVLNDNNSCVNAAASPEITDFNASVFRSGIGSTTCDATSTNYDPNNCYTTGVATTTWNISCAATTSPSDCTGATDPSQTWECTFPLWYVSDPTDGGSGNSLYFAQDWRAAVSGVDDNSATGPFVQSTTASIEVQGLLAFDLNTLAIPYGSLAPGDNNPNLTATTTASSTGNVGVDTDLSGLLMCPDSYPVGTCPAAATSSIPVTEQEYATSSLPYGSGTNLTGADVAFDLNIPKPTATSSLPGRVTYWGIRVPAAVTLAGIYTGQNTFTAVLSDPAQW